MEATDRCHVTDYNSADLAKRALRRLEYFDEEKTMSFANVEQAHPTGKNKGA